MADIDDRKAALIRELAARRARLTDITLALRGELDLSRKLRANIRRSPLAWLGGAIAAGLVATRFWKKKSPPMRAKHEPPRTERGVKAAAAIAALKLAFDLVRPALLNIAGNRLNEAVGRWAGRGSAPDGGQTRS
jgi:hypothetical protein